MLTTVHDVRIYLPSKVKNHAATARFSADLERSMKSNTALGTLGPNDHLDRHTESMRAEIESFIFHNKYGYKDDGVPDLTEQDYFEDEPPRAEMAQLDNDSHDNSAIPEQFRLEDKAARAAMAEWEVESQDIPVLSKQEYLDKAARQELARMLKYDNNNNIEVGSDGDDGNDLLFVGPRPVRLSPMENSGEDGEVEQHPTIFTGAGRTLGPTDRTPSSPSNKSSYRVRKRIVTRDVIMKQPDGTTSRRVAFVDLSEEVASSAGYKHSLQRGVSGLDVNNLDIASGDQNVSKTLKRDLEDSPGRSRNTTRWDSVDLTDDTGAAGTLDLSSLARAREARMTNATRLRMAGWSTWT